MSYLNHAQDPGRRATAIVTVGAVHALLAAGLLTGLAVNFDDIVERRLIGTTVPLDPPEPDPAPTPTAKPTEPVDTTIVVPPTPYPPQPGPKVETQTWENDSGPTVIVDPGPTPPPLPPPSPSFTPKSARPSNSSSGWITTNDYPRRALIDEVEGLASYRLVIGTNGRVASCELTRPTGNRALDDATCRLLTNRARFEPATDESGAKVMGTYTGSVRWEIPD